MKQIKKLLALLLCMSILIGLPLSIQAVEKDDFRILAAIASPVTTQIFLYDDSTNRVTMTPDNAVILYLNRAPTAENLPATGTIHVYDAQDKLMTVLSVKRIDNPYGGNTQTDISASDYTQSSRYNGYMIDPNNAANIYKTFSAAEKAGAVRFELRIKDSENNRDYKLKGMLALADNSVLKTDAEIDGVDAIKMDIITQNDYLAIENATKVNDQTILVKFSEPIAMRSLKADGGPVDIWLRVVDSNNVLQKKSDGKNAQWQPTEASICVGNEEYMLLTIPDLAKAEATLKELKSAGNDFFLKLHVADVFDKNESQNQNWLNYGKSANNRIIDGIWSTTSNCPLIADTRAKSDYTNLSYSDGTVDDIVAWIGHTPYFSQERALTAAKDGDTVTLARNVTSTEQVLMVPAGVTLDLDGHTVKAANLMSFGHIIDSSEGEGGIVINKDKTQAAIYMWQGNQAFPLYDAQLGGFRFYSYTLASVGTKNALSDADASNDSDLTWVRFGIKLRFESEKAYELLAHDDNQDAALLLDVYVGNQTFVVRFSQNTLKSLAAAVSENFANRTRKAVYLTIYGLDNLAENAVLKAKPRLYSGRDVAKIGTEMSYLVATPQGMAKDWIQKQIDNDTLFSFDYDGVPYAEHIGDWDKEETETDTGWKVTYRRDGVVAWSEITYDEETASVEWTNYFINEGDADSPVISNIQAVNSSVSVANPQLTTAEGSTPSIYDFQPIHVNLVETEEYSMKTRGGRSSQGAFPYFEIHNGEYGVFGAIGWTGDWHADFVNQDGMVQIVAGMQKTNISLHAGEDMRTPMIMLQFYQGDQTDGHNAFRQLMLKNYSPKDEEGKTITSLPVFVSINASSGEDEMISTIEKVLNKNRKFDGMWIDATWYGDIKEGSDPNNSGWAGQVGNWYFIKDLYPNGNMLKTRNWLEDHNKELLVWFEPERVMANTVIAREHPEWILGNLNSTERLLFDFSNDEARDYMIDLIDGLIKENRIDWYRQDFNIDPATKWLLGDDNANRVGMTEIKHITNLYYFLDELVNRNPGLMIDNCASGGKRLDLEMSRRSFPLWRTDINTDDKYCGTPDSIRSISYNLSWWIPLHGGGYSTYSHENISTTYNMRCYFTGGSMRPSYADESPINSIIDDYYEYRDLLSGEYYMLDYGTDDEIETKPSAYEYYRPEQGRGMIMAFCPAKGETGEVAYKLKGLDPVAIYRVTVTDTGEVWTASGQSLMEKGLTCRYPEKAYSMLIYLNKI